MEITKEELENVILDLHEVMLLLDEIRRKSRGLLDPLLWDALGKATDDLGKISNKFSILGGWLPTGEHEDKEKLKSWVVATG